MYTLLSVQINFLLLVKFENRFKSGYPPILSWFLITDMCFRNVKRANKAGNITSKNHVCMMASDRGHIRLHSFRARERDAAKIAEMTCAEGAVARATCKN